MKFWQKLNEILVKIGILQEAPIFPRQSIKLKIWEKYIQLINFDLSPKKPKCPLYIRQLPYIILMPYFMRMWF